MNCKSVLCKMSFYVIYFIMNDLQGNGFYMIYKIFANEI